MDHDAIAHRLKEDVVSFSISASYKESHGEKSSFSAVAGASWKTSKTSGRHCKLCVCGGGGGGIKGLYYTCLCCLLCHWFCPLLQVAPPDPDAIKLLKGHQLPVTCVAIAPNDRVIFSGAKDSSIIKCECSRSSY